MKKITLFILFILTLNFNSYSQSPCDYSVTLNDSYGDGWNGASINILVDNIVVLPAITVLSGFDETFSIPNVADGAVITSVLLASGSYPGEISWDIKNNIGSIVDSGNQSTDVNIAVACQTPIVPPTNISSSTATLINCGETLMTNSLGSTATPEDSGCTMSDLGVWYTFVGTGLDVTVTVTASFDQELAIASGTPGALVNEVCVDSGFTSETATIATTLGTNYYIYTAHWGTSNSTGEISVNLECATCTPATVVATVVNDCDVSGGFLIDLDVTSLGSATSLQFYDGSDFVTVTATGTVQYGPYMNGTLVDFQIDPNDDSSCALFFTGLTQAVCPPANDECSGAIEVTCGNTYSGNTSNATPEVPDPGTCTTTAGSAGAVWYKFTGTNSDDPAALLGTPGDDVTLDLSGSDFDTKIRVFEGDCGALVCVGGNDDGGTGTTSLITITTTVGTDYYVLVHGFSANTGNYSLDVSCVGPPSCAPATIVTTVVNDCDVSGGFLIDLDVTSLGSATSLQFYDGTDFVTVTATGTVQYGPYTNGTLVDFQIDHDSDSSCNLFATGLTQLACPPANDECSGAIALSNDGTVVNGTTVAATGAGGAMSCNGSIGNNVWYTLTGDGGDITVNVVAANEGAQIGIYESSDGSCSGFTEGTCIESVDDLGVLDTEVTFASTIGTVYYVNLGAWISSGDDFPFTVSATSSALSNDDFGNLAAFTYYPNPVNNILTLDAQNNIESVVAYNMLGQEVLRLSPNTVNAEVDMSSLVSGAYFVKVSIQGATKTVRVIKQ